ncbi:hypothetical protein [Nocardioides pacificus]
MAAPTTDKRQEPGRTSMLIYGLIFGPALGMLLALILVGGDAIAWGLIVGAGLGVVIGTTWDAWAER